MIHDVLREIGLTESENKIYLALLDLGDSTRGDIVNKSGVAGSKVYDLLERLREKGLVSIYVKDKVKHFKPINPRQLLIYLEDKKRKVLEIEKQTQNILPELLSKFNSSKEYQEVELISGMHGMEVLFREQVEILKKGDCCYVIGGTWGTGESTEKLIQTFFEKVHVMREEKGIKTKLLFNSKQKDTTDALYSSKKFPGTSTRYIEHASPVAINIYKDRTILIIFGKKISAIHIKSIDVANSFMEYFNILWKIGKK